MWRSSGRDVISADDDLLRELLQQEKELQFSRFTNLAALELGTALLCEAAPALLIPGADSSMIEYSAGTSS
jgi:hypothetical protein